MRDPGARLPATGADAGRAERSGRRGAGAKSQAWLIRRVARSTTRGASSPFVLAPFPSHPTIGALPPA
jgi:hypothetical protein